MYGIVWVFWVCWVGFVLWQRSRHEQERQRKNDRKERRANQEAEIYRLQQELLTRQLHDQNTAPVSENSADHTPWLN